MSQVYDAFGRNFWIHLHDLQEDDKVKFHPIITPEISRLLFGIGQFFFSKLILLEMLEM